MRVERERVVDVDASMKAGSEAEKPPMLPVDGSVLKKWVKIDEVGKGTEDMCEV